MPIQRFLHTALNVTDLAKASYFYEQVLGLERADRDLNFAGTWYQIGDVQLHLIVTPTVPPIGVEDKWGRNRHLAFAIASVDAMQQRLAAHGWAFQMSSSGRRALFVCDPDDNVIELGEV
jgi:glyoxylase I family protein